MVICNMRHHHSRGCAWRLFYGFTYHSHARHHSSPSFAFSAPLVPRAVALHVYVYIASCVALTKRVCTSSSLVVGKRKATFLPAAV